MTFAAFIHAAFLIAIVGFVAYLLVTYVPMLAPFKQLVTFLAVLAVCAILLNLVGFGHLSLN